VFSGCWEAPRLVYLEELLPVQEDVLAMAGPVKPTEVFRLAAPCVEKACCHFDGKDCKLATRIVQILPAVVDALPPCRIRAECRWYLQEGGSACMRCPQVITQNCSPSAEMVRAATPA
jgi:hypothetical protein